MVNDQPRKFFFLMKNSVQLKFQFYISLLIGIIYAILITNEISSEFINKILPSGTGPDFHQYLPIVVSVLIYSWFIQDKRMNLLKKITYSCFHIFIVILSFISSLIFLLIS